MDSKRHSHRPKQRTSDRCQHHLRQRRRPHWRHNRHRRQIHHRRTRRSHNQFRLCWLCASGPQGRQRHPRRSIAGRQQDPRRSSGSRLRRAEKKLRNRRHLAGKGRGHTEPHGCKSSVRPSGQDRRRTDRVGLQRSRLVADGARARLLVERVVRPALCCRRCASERHQRPRPQRHRIYRSA